MKPYAIVLALAALMTAPAAIAGERWVTLKVDGMDCAACPFIIKQSLSRVDGVIDVSVSYAKKDARVRFDDDKTGVAALTEATAGVGFPSRAVAE